MSGSRTFIWQIWKWLKFERGRIRYNAVWILFTLSLLNLMSTGEGKSNTLNVNSLREAIPSPTSHSYGHFPYPSLWWEMSIASWHFLGDGFLHLFLLIFFLYSFSKNSNFHLALKLKSFIAPRDCDFDQKLKELSVNLESCCWRWNRDRTFATSMDVANLHSSDIDSQNSNWNTTFGIFHRNSKRYMNSFKL